MILSAEKYGQYPDGVPSLDDIEINDGAAFGNATNTPLPDCYDHLRSEGLAYFHYFLTDKARTAAQAGPALSSDLEALVSQGYVDFDPIVYEDFLPVSAAGIFQSNLGDNAANDRLERSNRGVFEHALGGSVADEFALYQALEDASIKAVFDEVNQGASVSQ